MAKTDTDSAAFTEQLQNLLGSAQQQAKDWLGQRESISATLTNIRDTANRLLQELTGGGADMAVAVRRGRGRPPGSTAKRGRKKGRRRKMSAAARKAISEAQKKRWAKQKAKK